MFTNEEYLHICIILIQVFFNMIWYSRMRTAQLYLYSEITDGYFHSLRDVPK